MFIFPKEHVRTLNSKKLKITHFLLLKAHATNVISIVLHYEQLFRAPTSANE